MKTVGRIVLFLVFVTCTAYEGSVFAKDELVLAQIGDEKITLEDFNRFISSYPPEKQQFLAENPKNKVILLNRMVQVKSMAMTAKAKGLDKDPLIRKMLDYYADEILAQELITRETAKLDISEEDMRIYYKANENLFRVGEAVRVRHILFKVDSKASEEDRKGAREKAEEVLKRVKSGEDFAKLATELSDDAGSKNKGGDLGFVTKGRMVKAFEDAAFSLKPGETSGVVETKFGYHIIKSEEKREAGVEPFEEVKDKVRAKLTEDIKTQKRKDIVEKALHDAHAEIHPELIPGGQQ